MQILFSFQKNSSSKLQKQNISFEAGLTPKIMQEIQKADVLEISRNLAKKGIPTDFKGNQVIAWCSKKTIEISEQLNKKYKLNLALPKGIYVEDFEYLNVDNPNMYGFCNLVPAKLKKNSDEIISEKILFFNNNLTWLDIPSSKSKFNNWFLINEIADSRYEAKKSSTDSFLYTFLHDLAHVAHEGNLLSTIGGKSLFEKARLVNNKKHIENFQKKYGLKLSKICNNALMNEFDAIACDMSRIIANSLDKETLMPTKNPFIETPYEKLSFLQRVNIPKYSDEERPLKEILRNFWNGKFE